MILIKRVLNLKQRKNLKIEKDQKIFHLKGLKKKEVTKQLLNNLTNSLILTFWIL